MSQTAKPKGSGKQKTTQRTAPTGEAKPNAQVTKSRGTQRTAHFEEEFEEEEDTESPSLVGVTKRGPKPNHRPDLFAFRDHLVMVLENYWPEIEHACRLPLDRQLLLDVLSAINRKSGVEGSEHLLTRIGALTELVESRERRPPHKRRFRNDPRQVANAMAGALDVSFWTSLRKCELTDNACQASIGERSIRAYIGRKHPRLVEIIRLFDRSDTKGNQELLNEYDLRDEQIILCKNVERLQRAWDAGKPDWKALGVSEQYQRSLGLK